MNDLARIVLEIAAGAFAGYLVAKNIRNWFGAMFLAVIAYLAYFGVWRTGEWGLFVVSSGVVFITLSLVGFFERRIRKSTAP